MHKYLLSCWTTSVSRRQLVNISLMYNFENKSVSLVEYQSVIIRLREIFSIFARYQEIPSDTKEMRISAILQSRFVNLKQSSPSAPFSSCSFILSGNTSNLGNLQFRRLSRVLCRYIFCFVFIRFLLRSLWFSVDTRKKIACHYFQHCITWGAGFSSRHVRELSFLDTILSSLVIWVGLSDLTRLNCWLSDYIGFKWIRRLDFGFEIRLECTFD